MPKPRTQRAIAEVGSGTAEPVISKLLSKSAIKVVPKTVDPTVAPASPRKNCPPAGAGAASTTALIVPEPGIRIPSPNVIVQKKLPASGKATENPLVSIPSVKENVITPPTVCNATHEDKFGCQNVCWSSGLIVIFANKTSRSAKSYESVGSWV